MKFKHILLGALCLVSVGASACWYNYISIDPVWNIQQPVPDDPATPDDLLMDLGEIRMPFTLYSTLDASGLASNYFGNIERICLEYRATDSATWTRVKDFTTSAAINRETGSTLVKWDLNFRDAVALFGREVINDPALKGKDIIIRLYAETDLLVTGDLNVDVGINTRLAYWYTPGTQIKTINNQVVSFNGGWKPGFVFTAHVSEKTGIKR